MDPEPGERGREPCAWCRGPIDPSKRSDSKHCHKRCRQSHWRFAKHGVVAAVGATPLRLAYADPPYPGKAHLYRGHPDYAGEVDHRELAVALSAYDGWALSTSAEALPAVLGIFQELGIHARVASWHRGPRKVKSHAPWQGWEPVLCRCARSVAPAGVSDAFDFVSRPRTSDPDRVIGAKPAAFAFWVFQLMGARVGDSLEDMFPGSGGISRAWELFAVAPAPRDGSVAEDLSDASPRGRGDGSVPSCSSDASPSAARPVAPRERTDPSGGPARHPSRGSTRRVAEEPGDSLPEAVRGFRAVIQPPEPMSPGEFAARYRYVKAGALRELEGLPRPQEAPPSP